MKKYLFSLISLIILMGNLCLTSCSKDEGEPSIVGTWLMTDRSDDGYTYYSMYQFRGDGTFAGKDWSSESSEPDDWDEGYGKWTIKDNHLILDWDDEVFDFEFTLNGNKLTLYDPEDGEAMVFIKQ